MPGDLASTIDAAGAERLMAPLTELIAHAAAAILKVDQARVKTVGKEDGSPVTEADLAADQIIAEGLSRIAAHIPLVSEESVGQTHGPYDASFFLVDPLDGTKEFISGHNDYTVNIALVTAGRPLLGLVCAPALGLIWRGIVGHGAERLDMTSGATSATAIRTRPFPGNGWVAAVSRSHLDSRTEAFIAAREPSIRQPIGSALKFCRIAEGSADIYPRLAGISEWDIAAGHAVVEAAGGRVTDTKGEPLRFGQKRGSFAVPEFIAWGDPALLNRLT